MAQPFRVVDPKLAAGRGDEFSAARLREQAEAQAPEESYCLPINQRIEDSLDSDGLQMASVHESIPESNRGFQMLQRMGWKGQGLGTNEDGIVEPVGGGAEAGVRLGLGKQEEDDFYTSADNIQRKRLEVEIQADEDESRTAKREMQAAREQQIRVDVSNIKRTFYCEVCHKQYNSAAELDVHLSSYDHHHRKRLVEMRSAEYERTRKDRDRKEKKRQSKEMARLNEQIQKARGNDSAVPLLPPEEPPLPPGPPPLPSELPPPLPPSEPPIQRDDAGFASRHQTGVVHQPQSQKGSVSEQLSGEQRSAVQFNMGKPALIQTSSAGRSVKHLGIWKPLIQKGRLKSSVAAFAADSDDDS